MKLNIKGFKKKEIKCDFTGPKSNATINNRVAELMARGGRKAGFHFNSSRFNQSCLLCHVSISPFSISPIKVECRFEIEFKLKTIKLIFSGNV